MTRVAKTSTATSAPDDQRVRLVIEAEIFQDLDGGPDSLIYSTDTIACEPISPARLRGLVTEARAQLDEIERLARAFEADDTIRAILAEHDLTLVEVDMVEVAAFGADLAPHLGCWAGKDNGRLTVWVPKEQDPVTRANALAALVNDPGSVVQEG